MQFFCESELEKNFEIEKFTFKYPFNGSIIKIK